MKTYQFMLMLLTGVVFFIAGRQAQNTPEELSCDFSEGFCNWTPVGYNLTKRFLWTRSQGTENNSQTGPRRDHTTGQGWYVFLDSPDPKDKYSDLVSFPLNQSVCLEFWYHMWGKQRGGAILMVSYAQGNRSVATPPTRLPDDNNILWQKKWNQGNMWYQAKIPVNVTQSYKIVFTGSLNMKDAIDIAIDDVSVRPLNKDCNSSVEESASLYVTSIATPPTPSKPASLSTSSTSSTKISFPISAATTNPSLTIHKVGTVSAAPHLLAGNITTPSPTGENVTLVTNVTKEVDHNQSSMMSEILNTSSGGFSSNTHTRITGTGITVPQEHSPSTSNAAAIKTDISRTTPSTDYQTATPTTDHQTAASTDYQSSTSSTDDQTATPTTDHQTATPTTDHQTATPTTDHQTATLTTHYQTATSADHQSSTPSTDDQTATLSAYYRTALPSTVYQTATPSTGYQTATSLIDYQTAIPSTDYQTTTLIDYQTEIHSKYYQTATPSTDHQTATSVPIIYSGPLERTDPSMKQEAIPATTNVAVLLEVTTVTPISSEQQSKTMGAISLNSTQLTSTTTRASTRQGHAKHEAAKSRHYVFTSESIISTQHAGVIGPRINGHDAYKTTPLPWYTWFVLAIILIAGAVVTGALVYRRRTSSTNDQLLLISTDSAAESAEMVDFSS